MILNNIIGMIIMNDLKKVKQIIWVFGESATGKLTFINNLCNGNTDTIKTFNLKENIINGESNSIRR